MQLMNEPGTKKPQLTSKSNYTVVFALRFQIFCTTGTFRRLDNIFQVKIKKDQLFFITVDIVIVVSLPFNSSLQRSWISAIWRQLNFDFPLDSVISSTGLLRFHIICLLKFSVYCYSGARSLLNPTVMGCFSFLCGGRSGSATRHSGGRPGSATRHSEFGDELYGVHNVNLYTYRELRIATNDFSPANKIGEGGFGSVYKGTLRNGQMVAVKVLSAESKQGVREFLTEIQTISDVEHENLVKLYGCCVEGNHQILVYNFLENNSLTRTLLGGSHCDINFSWHTRVKICIGVARGLAYLHEEVRPHIVHRDIKASNILLDRDLTPKISDFGLAKLIPPNMTHVSTRVAGTIGYLAPEYAIRGQLTRRADIYSFGVLLIEIVSGRCNTNTRLPIEEQYILERAWQLYERKELVLLVDTALNGDFDAEQACRFLKIGLLCTQDSPKLRPSMSTVVQMLTGAKDVDDNTITKPGLISDFMDLKIRSSKKPKPDTNQTSSSYNFSGSGTLENTTLTSAPSSQATMSFTAIYDRST